MQRLPSFSISGGMFPYSRGSRLRSKQQLQALPYLANLSIPNADKYPVRYRHSFPQDINT